MVFANKYAEIFLEKFPNFRNSEGLKDAIEMFANDAGILSASGFFSGLTDYFSYKLALEENIEERIAILTEIERILNEFHEFPIGTNENDFQNEACVSFLENLQNHASYGSIKYSDFIPFLGQKSKDFCKYWDFFTDVRSFGLWTDEEWNNRFNIPFLGPNTKEFVKYRDILNNMRTPEIWTDEEWSERHLSK